MEEGLYVEPPEEVPMSSSPLPPLKSRTPVRDSDGTIEAKLDAMGIPGMLQRVPSDRSTHSRTGSGRRRFRYGMAV